MSPDWNAALLRVMLESSLRVCLLAAAVGGILLLARVRSGSVRHAAWSAVLGAMLLMPVLPYCVPTVAVPLPAPARSIEAIPDVLDIPAPLPVQQVADTSARTPAPAGVLASSPQPTPAAAPVHRSIWPVVALAGYTIGGLFLLFRLLLGWRALRRIVRGSRRLSPADVRCPMSDVSGVGLRTFDLGPRPPSPSGFGVPRRSSPYSSASVGGTSDFGPPTSDLGPRTPDFGLRTSDFGLLHESTALATPMTVGIFAPKILLPAAWKLWPDEKLRAVLAHELAHVRRRDPLTALLARLNLCLFWFHPVAWWLERKLAMTAEDASDEAGVRVMGEKRRYAEVLLDMAEAVRRAGGRFSWDGVGVHDSGLLGQRIDRVLRGELFREVSMTRKAIVAIGCAVAIFIVIACRQQRPAPPPLKPDPKIVEQQNRNKADSELYKAARAMNAAQVAELEAYLQKNPEDLTARRKALMFYQPSGEPVPGEKGKWAAPCTFVIPEAECVANRRPHILWLIERHPDIPMAGEFGAHIFPTPLDPLPDPVGYEQAKKLWLTHVARADVSAAVLNNAFWFFCVPDKALAEKIALRAQSLDPKGRWSVVLGELYALVIFGSNASMPMGVVRSVRLADAHGAYAQDVRASLDASKDAAMLRAAGFRLMYQGRGVRDRLDFDPAALGRSYVERSVQLDPNSDSARRTLVRLRTDDRYSRRHDLLKGATGEARHRVVSALPDGERFEFLPALAAEAFMNGEFLDYDKHDTAGAKAEWERCRKYAQDLVDLAPKFKDDPAYGAAILHGNIALGTVAMRLGDKTAAVRYMREAAKAPASEELAYTDDLLWSRLATDLLRFGERESVAQFLEWYAQIRATPERATLQKAAAAIRAGIMPAFYQARMMRQ